MVLRKMKRREKWIFLISEWHTTPWHDILLTIGYVHVWKVVALQRDAICLRSCDWLNMSFNWRVGILQLNECFSVYIFQQLSYDQVPCCLNHVTSIFPFYKWSFFHNSSHRLSDWLYQTRFGSQKGGEDDEENVDMSATSTDPGYSGCDFSLEYDRDQTAQGK